MLLRLLSGAVVAALALLLSPRPASAGCGVPGHVEFAPPSGAVVPRDGAVLVFIRTYLKGAGSKTATPTVVGPRGDALPATTRELHGDDRLRVVRVQLGGAYRRARVEVTVGGKLHAASYRQGRRPAPRGQTRLVAAAYHEARGCPRSSAFVLQIQPRAAAYRVKTVEGKAWIVPDRRAYVTGIASDRGVILVGLWGCADLSVQTRWPLHLEVTPLFASGQQGATLQPRCTQTAGGLTCRSHTRRWFGGAVRSGR